MKIEVEVSKEAHELMAGLAKVVAAMKVALADGFQPGADLPAVVVAAVAALPEAIAGVEKLPAEVKAEKGPFIHAVALGAADIVEAVMA